jgi:hypothetical protein
MEKSVVLNFNRIFEKSLTPTGSLIVRGKATTNIVDRDGESLTIPPKALKEAWPLFQQKEAPVKVEHRRTEEFGDLTVGKVLNLTYSPDNWEYDPINKPELGTIPPKMEIEAVVEITDPRAIQRILSGWLNSFSIGLGVPDDAEIQINNTPYKVLVKVTINELTLCNTPVNPECSFDIVTDESLAEQYGVKIGERLEAYGQPAYVKGYYVGSDNNKYFELDFGKEYLKSVKVKADETKAITGATPESGSGLVGQQFVTFKNKKRKGQFKVGDFVKWGSSGGTTRGKIEVISKDHPVVASDYNYNVTPKENNPATLIRIYRDGKPTKELVAHLMGSLTKTSIEKATAPTYNDYPISAVNNARKVLKWIKKYGRQEVSGMTPVGLKRANQLAKKESLSRSTIARMASFKRHQKNAVVDPKFKDTPWKDRGYIAWLGWGGDTGVNWAIQKLNSIEKR